MKKLTLAILLAIGSAQASITRDIVLGQIDSTGEQATLATIQVEIDYRKLPVTPATTPHSEDDAALTVVGIKYKGAARGDLEGIERLHIPHLTLNPALFHPAGCPGEFNNGWVFGVVCRDDNPADDQRITLDLAGNTWYREFGYGVTATGYLEPPRELPPKLESEEEEPTNETDNKPESTPDVQTPTGGVDEPEEPVQVEQHQESGDEHAPAGAQNGGDSEADKPTNKPKPEEGDSEIEEESDNGDQGSDDIQPHGGADRPGNGDDKDEGQAAGNGQDDHSGPAENPGGDDTPNRDSGDSVNNGGGSASLLTLALFIRRFKKENLCRYFR